MLIFKGKKELKSHLKKLKGSTLGFVPTMGALHLGHISLIEESVQNNTYTIASIFVNPTQFDKEEDLDKYPRTLEQDLIFLEENGCDFVFTPSVEEIYKDNVNSDDFDFDGLENEMEGQFRKGHFNGVGTIVKTLFEIVEPTNAYFGEKDFQQLQIIRKMVEKTNLNVNIIGCPIHREKNGLAMSSRNERLSEEIRNEAAFIYKILQAVQNKYLINSIKEINNWVSSEFEKHPLFDLEYFTIADENTLKTIPEKDEEISARAFIAVYADSIRLIDNIALHS